MKDESARSLEERSGHPIADLFARVEPVSPRELVRDVADAFLSRPELDALAVVEDGRPVGLVTRTRLLVRLARNLGHPLVARKRVAEIADPEPLILPGATDVVVAVARALARPDEAVYDEVIVVDEDARYMGLLPVRRLVEQQGVALAHSRRERELALARAAELERLDVARSRFLAHATHELRSPVAVVTAAADLVRRSAERGAWEEVQARLPRLLRAATTLRGTVDNILDVSRLEAGKAEVVLSAVELRPLLGDLAAATTLLVAGKEVAVEVDGDRAPRTISSDAEKLRQILTNLVSNAAKFTREGRIVVGAEAAGDAVRLFVSDTGVGIREEDLPRLFVPYERIRAEGARAPSGTGLGLVIARSLAELLGGALIVSSRYGQGTRVDLRLPGAGAA
ncbi:MAG TPA: ATP-binding protein [Anaeromyxobacteraceae bacterium]|nr:ATP-binding protein [Anaeromyxobacteraceae bacterium]